MYTEWVNMYVYSVCMPRHIPKKCSQHIGTVWVLRFGWLSLTSNSDVDLL